MPWKSVTNAVALRTCMCPCLDLLAHRRRASITCAHTVTKGAASGRSCIVDLLVDGLFARAGGSMLEQQHLAVGIHPVR